eukprot:g3784.t1
MLRAFKNGAIKDPVARRIERKRLERLNRIKSTVKARGHNNAHRAAMQRLNRRGSGQNAAGQNGAQRSASHPSLHKSTLTRRHLRDVTNRAKQPRAGFSQLSKENGLGEAVAQKPYDPNSAEAILARAKKATAEARAKAARESLISDEDLSPQHESDDTNDDSFIRDANDSTHDGNELDASFDTLWNFHAKKNKINMDPSVGKSGEEGDLEELSPIERSRDSPHRLMSHDDGVDITKDIHVGSAAPANVATRRENAFVASPRVHNRVSSAGAASTASSRLGEEENVAFQAAWSAATPIQLHGEDIDQREKGINMEGIFSDERSNIDSESECATSRDTWQMEKRGESVRSERVSIKQANKPGLSNGVGTNSWAPPSLVNMEKNWERRGDTSDLQFDPLSRARRSDPKGLLAALEADPEGTLRDSRHNENILRRSSGKPNLHGPPPHYATRTRARPAVLKPMLNQNTREKRLLNKNRIASAPESGSTKGSWRGGGCSDPHKAEERDNVLKVRRREQEAAREKARRWRKRRLKREATLAKEEKREKVAAEENHTVKAKEDKAAHAKGGSAEEITPAKHHGNGVRTGSLSSLKAEKDEASALLAEVMSSAADAVLEDQLHTHRELEEEEDGTIHHQKLHENLVVNTSQKKSVEFAPPPSSPSVAKPTSPKAPSGYTVPQLNLSSCEPDLSEEDADEDEDEPFVRSPVKFELD